MTNFPFPQNKQHSRKPALILCGYGTAGATVSEAFLKRGLLSRDITVIDVSADAASKARERGHRTVCGNATDFSKLRVAGAGSAHQIVVCVADSAAAEVTRAIRQLVPHARLDILVRKPPAGMQARAAGAHRVWVLSDIAGQMLAESAFLSPF